MNQNVTLTEMLNAREQRAFRQQELQKTYQSTLLCFTMNIAGPVKNSPLIRSGFQLGKRLLEKQMHAQGIIPIHYEEINETTGNEAFYILKQNPLAIKRITADIEDTSPLGRLFDMDVLRENGQKIEREELGLAPRCCLICGKPAKQCARSRIHSIEELQARTQQILNESIEASDAADAASFAVRALLYEVCTTPKPGLVDRTNSGSHKDMDIFTFMDSACALHPYFEMCTKIGKQTAHLSPSDTFCRLRPAGRMAEAAMFSATNGINTHKGAVFSVGILCAALGRLPREEWRFPERILNECAAMTQGLTAADFAGLTEENAVTVGQKLYLKYQITGIRGQAEAGFPAVQRAGLPTLKKGLAHGLNINDAGCAALLALIASATDTNLIARSNLPTQQKIVEHLKLLLAENPFPDKQQLEQLDQKFIEKNLSPGGSADLLAICYFLYFLESEA